MQTGKRKMSCCKTSKHDYTVKTSCFHTIRNSISKGSTYEILVASFLLGQIQHFLTVIKSYNVFKSDLCQFNTNKSSSSSYIKNANCRNIQASTFTQLLEVDGHVFCPIWVKS